MSHKAVEDAVTPQSRPSEEEPGRASEPEHGGDAADLPGTADTAHDETPGWLAQVPYFLVLATMSAGIVVVAAAYFKRGPALIAGALLLAAAFRYLLPPDRIGMLAVRRRWIDIATTVTLAVLLIVLAWVAPQLSS
ncbi:hypothetical protein HNR23_000077 [Nocardiopsis mwathae]|uniref:DUF3017 domain-containing protein n=1 Tax=Nocardiopsis mwathae TaxID=1472723 RepID=A0A7W9YDB8_9ACTN|nr:hypothetical protein [Nocardiopsis mwathae]